MLGTDNDSVVECCGPEIALEVHPDDQVVGSFEVKGKTGAAKLPILQNSKILWNLSSELM